jgi:hypothetical protein
MRGIEPPQFAWEAKTLPLSYIRVTSPFPERLLNYFILPASQAGVPAMELAVHAGQAAACATPEPADQCSHDRSLPSYCSGQRILRTMRSFRLIILP